MTERKLPIGIQSSEDLRKNDYLYIDKTEYVWNLVSTGKTYFLFRPRRFGKSLLTSTIAAYFHGKKELFRGLAIEKHEKEYGLDSQNLNVSNRFRRDIENIYQKTGKQVVVLVDSFVPCEFHLSFCRYHTKQIAELCMRLV